MSHLCLRSPASRWVGSPVQLPIFLVPAFASAIHSAAPLSQSESASSDRARNLEPLKGSKSRRPPTALSRNKDQNKSRGVSAIRRTGPRKKLSIMKLIPDGLPRPNLDAERRKEFPTNPNHGLWKFFNAERTSMTAPEDQGGHGRAWEYAELENKDFQDLHALYWTCTLERNRIATDEVERRRVRAGYGAYEAEERTRTVNKTMQNIRTVLLDRYYNMREARRVLQDGTTPLHKMWLEYDDPPESGVDIDEPAEVFEEILNADKPLDAERPAVAGSDADSRAESQRG